MRPFLQAERDRPMRYPVILTPYSEGFTVSIPDIPEALTRGDDEAGALRNAADALESALDFYFEPKRPVPVPSRSKRGQASVELPASVAATVLLYNEMLEQKVRPAELAKRLNVKRQDVTRILNRKHPTKINTMSDAFKALGKRLELRVEV